MAIIGRRKTVKKTSKKKLIHVILSRIKLTESYTSLILGAVVVLITAILFVSLAKINREKATSSTKDIQTAEEMSDNLRTSSTYTIKPGDDLWTISENVYRDGYKWIEIARLNKLENPGLIHAGNKLMIPKKPVAQKLEQTTQTKNSIIQNNSITGNTYTIKSGDNLWEISVRAYGDGFRWPEIAKVNNIANPDLIYSNNILKIPR